MEDNKDFLQSIFDWGDGYGYILLESEMLELIDIFKPVIESQKRKAVEEYKKSLKVSSCCGVESGLCVNGICHECQSDCSFISLSEYKEFKNVAEEEYKKGIEDKPLQDIILDYLETGSKANDMFSDLIRYTYKSNAEAVELARPEIERKVLDMISDDQGWEESRDYYAEKLNIPLKGGCE